MSPLGKIDPVKNRSNEYQTQHDEQTVPNERPDDIPHDVISKKQSLPACVNYDTFLIEDNNALDELTGWLHNEHPESQLSYLSSPQALDDNDLSQKITVKEGKILVNKGVLYTPRSDKTKPTILLLDFRNMRPSERPEFNELFDTPPRLRGKRLAGNIQIISLINEEMSRSDEAPGPDFWRRVNQPDCHWDHHEIGASKENNIGEFLKTSIPEAPANTERHSTEAGTIVINLTGKDWRSELLGGVAIDTNNSPCFKQGKLASIKEGQCIILEDAPWDDPAFSIQIAQILKQGNFSANGEQYKLPDNIFWIRRPLSPEFLSQLKNQYVWEPAANKSVDQPFAIINKSLFPNCIKTSGISLRGQVVSHDAFDEWLGEAKCLRVTSSLTPNQWLTLLTRLQSLGRTGLRIIQDTPKQQPEGWQAPLPEDDNSSAPQPIQPSCLTVIANEAGLPPRQDKQLSTGVDSGRLSDSSPSTPLNVRLDPDTSLQSLCHNIEIPSLQEGRFTLTPTEFLNALQSGREIHLFGLEHNPDLAAELEPLMLSPAVLNLNGFKHSFPKANIRVHWPSSTSPLSPLWSDAVTQAEHQGDDELHTVQELQDQYGLNSENDASLLSQTSEHLTSLIKKINALPTCGKLPRISLRADKSLLSRVIQQALLEQELDRCSALSHCHIHKAINSVVIKPFRSEPDIYHHLKWLTRTLFLPPPEPWYEPTALRQWLTHHPEPTPETVTKHIWQLLQHIQPPFPLRVDDWDQVSPEPKKSKHFNEVILPWINALIVLHAPEALQPSVQKSLKVTSGELDNVRQQQSSMQPVNQTLETRLRDLCYTLNKEDKTVTSHTSRGLQERCHQTALFISRLKQQQDNGQSSDIDTAVGQERCQEQLKQLLPGLDSQDYQSIASELLSNETEALSSDRFWQHWINRRMQRLAAKINKHKVLFINGEPGAGKSWMAAQAAKQLNATIKPFILNIGPHTTTADLFGQNECVSDEHGQQKIVFKPGPLSQWANTRSTSPIVLILDEANLASPEVWDCLRGLYEEPPCVYLHGRQIAVSEQHRIVMTGNPDYFSGRAMNPFLKQRAPELFFKPLPKPFLASQIIKSSLTELVRQTTDETNELRTNDAINNMVNGIQALYQQYRLLIPGHEFTPRDITDCMARIDCYLSGFSQSSQPANLSLPMLHGLIRQAMADTLAGTITGEESLKLTALGEWYNKRFPCNDTIVQQQKERFNDFYTTLGDELVKQAPPGQPPFDLNNSSTKQLAYSIWLELERRGNECARKSAHTGRHAILIEGPAGRGKDAVLNHITSYWLKQKGLPSRTFQRINAGVNNWQRIQEKVPETFHQGDMLCLSEINLLPTKNTEGLCNDLLTRSPTPGFQLFATINPSHFSGRHALSPALQSRFTHLKVGDYSLEDLVNITIRLLGNNKEWARSLAGLHYVLWQALQQKDSKVLPSTQNLSQLATAINEVQPDSIEDCLSLFKKHYRLFIKAAGWNDQDLHGYIEQSQEPASSSPACTSALQNLTIWLNQTLGHKLDRPVEVRQGAVTQFIPGNGQLTLSATDLQRPLAEQKSVIRSTLSKQKWLASGLPLDWPKENDSLGSGIYTLLQQHHARQRLDNEPMDYSASDYMFMTPEEEETLNMEANTPYLEALPTIQQQKFCYPSALQAISELLAERVPDLKRKRSYDQAFKKTPPQAGSTPPNDSTTSQETGQIRGAAAQNLPDSDINTSADKASGDCNGKFLSSSPLKEAKAPVGQTLSPSSIQIQGKTGHNPIPETSVQPKIKKQCSLPAQTNYKVDFDCRPTKQIA